jgi:hypothetical protein
MHRHPTADVLVVGLGPVKAPIPVQLAQAVSQVPDHPAAIYSALTPRGRWHLDGLRAGAGSHQCVTNQTKVAQTPTQMVAHWTALTMLRLFIRFQHFHPQHSDKTNSRPQCACDYL